MSVRALLAVSGLIAGNPGVWQASVAGFPDLFNLPSAAGAAGGQPHRRATPPRNTAAQHRRAMPPRATASSTVTPTALPPQPRPLPHPPAVPTVAPRRQGHRGRQAALAAAVNQDGHTSAPSRGGVARDTTPAVSDGAQLRISGEGLSGATPSKGATRGWRRLLSLTAATTAATDFCH